MEESHTPEQNTVEQTAAAVESHEDNTKTAQEETKQENTEKPETQEHEQEAEQKQTEDVHSPSEDNSPNTHYPPLSFNNSPGSPHSPGLGTVKSIGSALGYEGDDVFKQRLMESTVLRKKAEDDAKVLANRIALLELEEQKTMKKVEETRRKAQEIMALKNRNLLHAKQKAELKKEREEEEKRKLQQNKIFKEQIRIAQEQKKAELQKELKTNVQDMKKTQKNFMERREKDRDEELRKNKEVARGIKHTERELQERKKKEAEEVKERAKQDYEKKIERENFKRQETHLVISELEQREQDLIKKLQATQNLQRIAFEDLEKVLATPAQEQ